MISVSLQDSLVSNLLRLIQTMRPPTKAGTSTGESMSTLSIRLILGIVEYVPIFLFLVGIYCDPLFLTIFSFRGFSQAQDEKGEVEGNVSCFVSC